MGDWRRGDGLDVGGEDLIWVCFFEFRFFEEQLPPVES
jgi:hypothetical protein